MSTSAQFNKIGWCHFTVNFWWGCDKVSPACAHCYAEGMAKRMSKKLFGRWVLWGKGQPRGARLAEAREECLKLQKRARRKGERCRVFLNSMSDWLDDEVPVEWLAEMLRTMHDCPDLDFLLLTKRPENWEPRLAKLVEGICAREGIAWQWLTGNPPANVWIGTTVEDQTRADARIPHLLKIPARIRFLSCEPLLGPVDVTAAFADTHVKHWVIAGGESGAKARPSHPDWFTSLRDQCAEAGVPFYFKQWGEWTSVLDAEKDDPDGRADYRGPLAKGAVILNLAGGCGFHGDRVQLMQRTKRAGCLLESREHKAIPNPQPDITIMAFKPAVFTARKNCKAAKLRYAVRNSNSKKPSPSLVFLILKDEAAKAGLTPNQLVRLDFDRTLGLGRLTPINSGVRRVREMKGSVCIQFPHNGDLADLMPTVKGTEELTISEQSKTEGLIFELPEQQKK